MANTGNSDKWYFTKEDLENTPSRKCGYDSFKELSHRQQAANFIQDMGQRLKVSQLCINTAIVYMHRFYVFHSFTNFPWYQMAAAALFLAAKVEEQPRKLEYVIRVANICRNPRDTSFDINSERYLSQSQDLVFNENILLQTLGFDFAIDHPHTHVVRCCHLVRASKDLAQTSYFMASNSLHLTTMCIQYKPTVVACFCILVACKWSNWEIPLSNEKKEWYSYVDPTVTADLLQQLTEEFLEIFETCPSRLKEKIMAISEQNVSRPPSSLSNSPFDTDPKKLEGKDHPALMHRHDSKSEDSHKHRSSRPHDPSSSSQSREQREREYKERKEREKMAAQRQAMMSGQSIKMSSSHHHRPPGDPKLKQHSSRPPSNPNFPQVNARVEPRDILREAARDSPFGLAKPIEKDNGQKRDYLMKPNVQTDPNNLNNYPPESRLNYSADNKQRVDPNRSRSAITNKHESALPQLPRKHDDQKPYLKSETDNIKKHLNAGIHDKNSAYLSKSSSSTSQKDKSPFTVDSMSKSVPRTNSSSQQCAPLKHSQHNGNGAYSSIPMTDNDIKIKQEPIVFKEEIKEEIPTPAVIKRPSLFSPEKTPPHKKQMKTEIDSLSSLGAISSLSPIISPEARRNRNYSSSSEPELRPVMKKIDQVEGFENLMRDNTIGMNKIHPNIPNMPSAVMKQEHGSIKQEYNSIKQEYNTINQEYNPIKQEYNPENDVKPQISANQTLENRSSHSAIVNGLETNPTLISNLLKEAPPVPHLPVVAAAENDFVKSEPHTSRSESKEKSHHKSKKKKEKHKNKDKDRNREDKEKKKKHKDKDREKHKHRDKHEHEAAALPPTLTEPIKLKIQKDKIHLPADTNSPIQIQTGSVGLKIKIPKDKIRAESIADLPQPSLTMPVMATGSLKIKIPKEVINNCNNSSLAGSSSSRKRERDRSSPSEAPAAKVSKSRESKQNGRHSYNKVAQMGDGGSAAHRLAESKYTSKNSS